MKITCRRRPSVGSIKTHKQTGPGFPPKSRECLGQPAIDQMLKSQSHACSQAKQSHRLNQHVTRVPIPSHRSRVLALFFFATILAAITQSGCTGVTSARSSSTTSTNSNTTPSGALTVSPAALTFGNVPVGSISNQSLTVTNSGTVAVTISQANATGAGFGIGGVSGPLTLSPGGTFTFTASFAPTAAGNSSGGYSIVSAQLSSPLTIQTTGTGVAVTPAITSQPVSQSVLIGQAATFSVTASGTVPLSYQWRK